MNYQMEKYSNNDILCIVAVVLADTGTVARHH